MDLLIYDLSRHRLAQESALKSQRGCYLQDYSDSAGLNLLACQKNWSMFFLFFFIF
jgi:hypothetical protein